MAHKNSHSAPRKKGGALKIVLALLVLLLVVAGGGVWMGKAGDRRGGTPGESPREHPAGAAAWAPLPTR